MGKFRTPGIVGPAAVSNKAQMFFANPLLLLGLVAVLIPPVVHFFSRRRYDEVDWGAMQFLRLTPKSRRKVLLDEWLLLVIRMAALGLLAVALAGPSVRSGYFARFDAHAPRTTVILIDASGSMAVRTGGRTATDAAREWASRFIDQMRPGDRVALFAVKGDVTPLLASPTPERDQARAALELLTTPRGTADWPAAVEMVRSKFGPVDSCEILVLTDGQQFGWGDANTLSRWEALARNGAVPRMWVVNVVPDRDANAANPTITSFGTNRSVATIGSEVRFDGTVTGGDNPMRMRLHVNGRAAGEISLTAKTACSFVRKLPLGSHLVSLSLGETVRHDVAVDVVPPHRVLVIEGDPASDILSRALSPTNDPAPAFVTRSLPIARFTPDTLAANTNVLVLANVTRLTPAQDSAVERFAAAGGGVLVTLGEQADASSWNRNAYRGGRGWLPGTILDRVTAAGANPRILSLDHPALRLFRNNHAGGLQSASFPRYWKLRPDSGAMLSLTNDDALLAEKSVGRGRVVVSAVPLDGSWETNLIRLPDYVPLVHELTHRLASGRLSSANVAPDESLVFRPQDNELPGAVTVVAPDRVSRGVSVKEWPAVIEARDPGPYRVSTTSGQVRYFVVRPDPREADLTPANDTERRRVSSLLGSVVEVTTPDELAARRGDGPVTRDFGDVLLVVVLTLFAAELWYTRRSATTAGV